MVSPQLLDYVRQQLAAGIPKEELSKSLITSGWQVSDINEAFASISPSPSTQMPVQNSVQPTVSGHKGMMTVVIAFLLLVGAGGAFAAYHYGLFTPPTTTPTPTTTQATSTTADFYDQTNAPFSPFCTTLQYGSENDVANVGQLQNALIKKGYSNIKLSSFTFDKDTLDAVTDFQKKNGINPTGVADAATLAKLYGDIYTRECSESAKNQRINELVAVDITGVLPTASLALLDNPAKGYVGLCENKDVAMLLTHAEKISGNTATCRADKQHYVAYISARGQSGSLLCADYTITNENAVVVNTAPTGFICNKTATTQAPNTQPTGGQITQQQSPPPVVPSGPTTWSYLDSNMFHLVHGSGSIKIVTANGTTQNGWELISSPTPGTQIETAMGIPPATYGLSAEVSFSPTTDKTAGLYIASDQGTQRFIQPSADTTNTYQTVLIPVSDQGRPNLVLSIYFRFIGEAASTVSITNIKLLRAGQQ